MRPERLYTHIPGPVSRYQALESIEYSKEQWKQRGKKFSRLEKVLINPKASEKQKRLARIELAGMDYRRRKDEQ